MIKEVLRFFVILITISISIVLTIFTIKYISTIYYFISTDKSEIIYLLSLIEGIILEHHILIFFITVFLTPLFFMNSIRIKIVMSYARGILITFVLGLLLFIGLFFFTQANIATAPKYSLSYSTNNIYKTYNIIKIGDQTLLYSSYRDKEFINTLLLPSISNGNSLAIFSPNGHLAEDKIVLNMPHYINNPEVTIKKALELPYVIDDKVKVFKSTSNKYSFANNPVVNYIVSIISNIPLLEYEGYLKSQINSSYKIGTDKGSIYKFISLLCEVIGIIIIFFSLGLLCSSKNMPILNLFTSLIVGLLAVYILSISYGLAEWGLLIISKYVSIPMIPGILVFLISIIFLLLAYIKYRNIKLQLS